MIVAGCTSAAGPFDESEARTVTAVVIRDFLQRYPPDNWPIVFISDEYRRLHNGQPLRFKSL